MNNDEQKKEQVIQEALKLLEQGRSEASILDVYPEFNKELVALFDTVHILGVQKSVLPSESILQSVLDKIATDSIKSPYQSTAGGGRFLKGLSNFQKISISFVAIVLLFSGGLFYIQSGSIKSGANPSGNNSSNFHLTTSKSDVASSNDVSDSSINQDTNELDTEINALNDDSNNVDQALNPQSS